MLNELFNNTKCTFLTPLCYDLQAFDVAEKEFGIEPILSGYEMTTREIIDKTAMLSYLSQFYELFRKQSVERDAGKNHIRCQSLYLLDLLLVSISVWKNFHCGNCQSWIKRFNVQHPSSNVCVKIKREHCISELFYVMLCTSRTIVDNDAHPFVICS